jgi:hypothetical protein
LSAERNYHFAVLIKNMINMQHDTAPEGNPF